MGYEIVRPVLDATVRALCTRPYANHPHGCPNHGRRRTCPPEAKPLEAVLDCAQPVWAIWTTFDLGAHVKRMRTRHPAWSWRQLVCCLYWQGTARKALRGEIECFHAEHSGLRVVGCPEACGVNVTATMATIGLHLQWPPKTITYQVALAGIRQSPEGGK